MIDQLAPVYVNDLRVRLQGDPRPKVAKVVQAAGRRPEGLHVQRLARQSDARGAPLRLADAIDRMGEGPIYLRCFDAGDPIWNRSGRPTQVNPFGGPTSSAGAPGALAPTEIGEPPRDPLLAGRPPAPAPEHPGIQTVSSRRVARRQKRKKARDPSARATASPPNPGGPTLDAGEGQRTSSGPGPSGDGEADLRPGVGTDAVSAAREVNERPRERWRAEAAEMEAQEDGTQRPPPR